MKYTQILKTAALAGAIATLGIPAAQAAEKLNGSGASFPFPIYSAWFKQFSQDKKVKAEYNPTGARVDYQAKGSGAGIKDFQEGAVDFAGSDAAMNDEEIAVVKEKQGKDVVLLPMTAGEVVLAYNVEGVDALKLPRDVYPEIFAGKITKWNDPKIADANPGVDLPDENITVVVRSDSSGTSFVFTGHLSAIDPAFKESVGQGKSPNWPNQDNFIKAPKNDGVMAQIKQNPGTIGYVEYGYAKLTGHKQVAMLQNKAGNYVEAGPESGAAALASAEFPEGTLPGGAPDLRAWIWDPAGDDSYPIASMTWLLLYSEYDEAKLTAMKDLVNYTTSDDAQDQADGLGYIPLPAAVIEKVKDALSFVK
ncbi:MAG: phosphate ABC transporter substrate-binding protein PstS [Thiohalocapsa sp.]|jgi:phosphate transport system substrate-binding protein|uniref:phosphate ABC transporter substrate-binding protein PstS n=1 Tax=Thiohalocapsa sp. TaxID=2497641 RepID=UPI0026008909|nr:phosphate ABC transporter substrate-binding protein PstS [Thiohalocapsa sp.]MCG6939797.1 phosphate ABC transporter substrate-binding protein PstS [Thiohalocapsa sp.]